LNANGRLDAMGRPNAARDIAARVARRNVSSHADDRSNHPTRWAHEKADDRWKIAGFVRVRQFSQLCGTI